jgi:hypothetical protein
MATSKKHEELAKATGIGQTGSQDPIPVEVTNFPKSPVTKGDIKELVTAGIPVELKNRADM